MKFNFQRAVAATFAVILAAFAVIAQSTPVAETVADKMQKSVVFILTGKGDGRLEKTSTGVIVRANGIILTSYRVVKDASQLQIRLGNGETFDSVELMGFDERRDVAALRIAAVDLPAVELRSDDAPAGTRILTMSTPTAGKAALTTGMMSTSVLADGIPNAGTGFRVVQFTAPVSPGSTGGLLADDLGRAIGLIVSTESYAQNLNYAIPLRAVMGLGDTAQSVMTFGRGTSLDLPKPPRPPAAAELVSTDPDEILRNAKLFAVTSSSTIITDKMMENGLLRRPDFKKWKLTLIDDPKLADVIINVKHILFTWEYRYTMYDRRTNIILGNGKIIEWEGQAAARRFSEKIMNQLRPLKEPPPKQEK